MVFNNNLLLGAGGSQGGVTPFDTDAIGNSVWLDGSADTLAKTFSSGSAQTKVVISTWVQRNSFGSVQDIFSATGGTGGATRNNRFSFQADDTIDIQVETTALATIIYSTTRVFRDIGWYSVLVSIDQGSSTADQAQLYINGEQVNITATSGAGTFTAAMSSFGNAALHNVGSNGGTGTFLNGYQTQTTMLVGQSIQNGDVAVTDFLDSFTYGTNGSQFAPKKDSNVAALASTAGGNSFCLDYGDSSDLGNDISSNNNDFSPTSMAAANQTGSSPSSAFATWNPLRVNTQTQTFAEGNLRFSSTQTSTNPAATGNYGVSSGKFYWEVFVVAQGNTSNMLGICDVEAGLENDTNALYASALMYSYEFAGTKRNNNSSASYGDSITTGDIVGIALDMDNGGVYFSKNGTFQASGDPTSGSSLTNAAFTGLNSAGSGTFQPYYLAYSNGDGVANFGQSPTFNGQTTAGGNTDANGRGNFKFSVPSGYTALTSANLSAPDYQGIDSFSPILYEGNGASQRVGDFVPFTDAFDVAKSAMFQHDEARALSRTAGTPSSSGGKKGTWSTWYKTANIDTDNIFFDTGTTATNRFSLQMDASGQIVFSYAGTTILMTNADLKGGGLWRNLVLKVDTALGTASARAIMYIDGVEVTSFATDSRSSLTQDGELGYMDSGATQFVGSYDGSSANQWDGYLAETIFLDNQFLSADSFGQLDTSTNKWVPKAISGLTLGDQGFYLAYGGNFGTSDGAGDSTGNSNNLTEIGTWTSADQFTDTPSKNYSIVQGSTKFGSATPALSEGNLTVDGADGGGRIITMQPTSGKWYFEIEITDVTGFYPGLITPATFSYTGTGPWNETSTFVILSDHPSVRYKNGSTSGSDWGAVFSNGDRMAVAWDVPNKKIYFGKAASSSVTWMSASGASGGNPATGVGAVPFTYTGFGADRLYFAMMFGSNNTDVTMKFISSGWEGAAPTDFLELNQDNLDDTASKITAWAWIKNRDATDNHILIDRVRGVGNDVHSNSDAAEVFNANTVQRFLQRGVQVGSDVEVNTANESYVLWQWLLGDSATTGSTNDDGSLDTTVIAADADHFSIVGWTQAGVAAAQTLGHGLTAAPELIFVKNRTDAGSNWPVYSEDVGNTKYMYLSTTAAAATFNMWQNTSPTSTVFSVSSNNEASGSANDEMIAYCFRSVAGVCKVGTYTGNGNANGPYIDLGFKPAFFMAKQSSAVENWIMLDDKRPDYNPTGGYLFANLTNAEGGLGSEYVDFLSSAVKIRTTGASINGSATFIYLAMADIGGNGTLPPVYGR